jgi:hypothetical protein
MNDRRRIEQLARQLHAQATLTGTLKPPRALGAMASSGGARMVATAAVTTWQDYLPEARRILLRRG